MNSRSHSRRTQPLAMEALESREVLSAGAEAQYMLNLIVNHQTRSHSIFGVDVEGYRRRREIALEELARRIADRVRQNGQAMTLEPMPPAERRIVHIRRSNLQ